MLSSAARRSSSCTQRFKKRTLVTQSALPPFPQHAIDTKPTENGVCHQDQFEKTSDAQKQGHGAKTIKSCANLSLIPVKDLGPGCGHPSEQKAPGQNSNPPKAHIHFTNSRDGEADAARTEMP